MNFEKPPIMETEKPCTKTQLAHEMGISLSTLQRLLKKADIQLPRKLIPPNVKKDILSRLGWKVLQ